MEFSDDYHDAVDTYRRAFALIGYGDINNGETAITQIALCGELRKEELMQLDGHIPSVLRVFMDCVGFNADTFFVMFSGYLQHNIINPLSWPSRGCR